MKQPYILPDRDDPAYLQYKDMAELEFFTVSKRKERIETIINALEYLYVALNHNNKHDEAFNITFRCRTKERAEGLELNGAGSKVEYKHKLSRRDKLLIQLMLRMFHTIHRYVQQLSLFSKDGRPVSFAHYWEFGGGNEEDNNEEGEDDEDDEDDDSPPRFAIISSPFN